MEGLQPGGDTHAECWERGAKCYRDGLIRDRIREFYRGRKRIPTATVRSGGVKMRNILLADAGEFGLFGMAHEGSDLLYSLRGKMQGGLSGFLKSILSEAEYEAAGMTFLSSPDFIERLRDPGTCTQDDILQARGYAAAAFENRDFETAMRMRELLGRYEPGI